jgi:hypothetical protein
MRQHADNIDVPKRPARFGFWRCRSSRFRLGTVLFAADLRRPYALGRDVSPADFSLPGAVSVSGSDALASSSSAAMP